MSLAEENRELSRPVGHEAAQRSCVGLQSAHLNMKAQLFCALAVHTSSPADFCLYDRRPYTENRRRYQEIDGD